MSSEKDYASQAPGATGVDFDHPASVGYRFEIVDADRGVVRLADGVAPRKKIAICGFAASTRMAAPFDDPLYEVWTLNQLYRHVPRTTRHFDVHDNWNADNVPGTDHVGWLQRCGVPVYMSTRDPSIPTAVNYPVDEVIRRVLGTDYFTSTVAFMLGLAIMEIDDQVEADVEALRDRMSGGTPDLVPDERAALSDPAKLLAWTRDRYAEREIGIFGIDLVVGEEYDFQKACVEYVLGLANARGIAVRIPPQSALLRQRWRYGYFREPDNQLVRLSELQRRNGALQNERNGLIARLQTIDGALQENGYWVQIADLRPKGASVKLNEDDST